MAFLDGSWVTCIIPCGSSSRRARDCFILGCSRYARSPKGQPLRSNLSSSRNLGAWAFSIAAPSRRRRLRQLSFLLWPSKLRFPDDTCDLNIYQNSNQKYNFGIISVCAHSLQCLLGRVAVYLFPLFTSTEDIRVLIMVFDTSTTVLLLQLIENSFLKQLCHCSAKMNAKTTS
jgi:hypothetical protein